MVHYKLVLLYNYLLLHLEHLVSQHVHLAQYHPNMVNMVSMTTQL